MSLDEELSKLLVAEEEESEEEKSNAVEELAEALVQAQESEAKEKKEEKREEEKEVKKEQASLLEIVGGEEKEASEKEEEVVEETEVESGETESSSIIPEELRKVLDKVPEPVEDEAVPPKYVILIYGDKGTGKTTTALSFPGEIVVLSFDRKSAIVKKNMYKNDKRIHVFDVVKYMDYSTDESMLKTSELAYLYALKVLDYAAKKIKPDWIVIDGAEIFQQICEWIMRYRHGLKPFEGIRNLNLWKYRKQLIRDLHNKALNVAKRGVIYTTNIEYQDIVVEGELVTRKDVPKWIDILIYETDIVLKTIRDPRTREFKVEVVTSKDDKLFPTGKVFTVTDKPLGTQINWEVIYK